MQLLHERTEPLRTQRRQWGTAASLGSANGGTTTELLASGPDETRREGEGTATAPDHSRQPGEGAQKARTHEKSISRYRRPAADQRSLEGKTRTSTHAHL